MAAAKGGTELGWALPARFLSHLRQGRLQSTCSYSVEQGLRIIGWLPMLQGGHVLMT